MSESNELTQQEQLVEQTRKRALAAKHVLQSENGQVLMSMLEIECNPSKLIGETPEKTAYNVGKRDVYVYLQEIINLREED